MERNYCHLFHTFTFIWFDWVFLHFIFQIKLNGIEASPNTISHLVPCNVSSLWLWSSSLSDHLPPPQSRYDFTLFSSHFIIISTDRFHLHGLFNALLLFLSFVPYVQFIQTFALCEVYTNMNLTVKFCIFKFLIQKFSSLCFFSMTISLISHCISQTKFREKDYEVPLTSLYSQNTFKCLFSWCFKHITP